MTVITDVNAREGRDFGLGAISGNCGYRDYWGKKKGRSMEGNLEDLHKKCGSPDFYATVVNLKGNLILHKMTNTPAAIIPVRECFRYEDQAALSRELSQDLSGYLRLPGVKSVPGTFENCF